MRVTRFGFSAGVVAVSKTAATLFAVGLGIVGAVGLSGCARFAAAHRTELAPGIVYVSDTNAGGEMLDIDLSVSAYQPVVVAAHIERRGNNFVGDAKPVREWTQEAGAIGGINGGYFGDSYDTAGTRKQIVGLAVLDGIVVAPGARTASTRTPGEKYLRSAAGFGTGGRPDISWATGTKKAGIRRYPTPLDTGAGATWHVRSAVACGPRLFVRGERRITDREERLVSPAALPRTFVAYDIVSGKPRHLILGCANAMTYAQVADTLAAYFRRAHGSQPHDALCMDGGGSSQLVYRTPDGILTDAMPARTTVPTAILLVKR